MLPDFFPKFDSMLADIESIAPQVETEFNANLRLFELLPLSETVAESAFEYERILSIKILVSFSSNIIDLNLRFSIKNVYLSES